MSKLGLNYKSLRGRLDGASTSAPFEAVAAADFRRGIDGLAQLCRASLVADPLLSEWAVSSGVDLAAFDAGQRWVLFAAVSFLEFVGRLAPTRRYVFRRVTDFDRGE